MKNKISFASDNYSGVHPKILEAIVEANHNHDFAYGNDKHTQEAVSRFKDFFGDNIDVYFVLNGTGANVLALKTLTQSFNSIICASSTHVNTQESTALEIFTGCRLLCLPAKDGKLSVDLIKDHLGDVGNHHASQPGAIIITQPTELGTLYTVDEIRSITAFAKIHNLKVFMDGTRIANASVALGLDFKTFTVDAGIDAMTFGGTKNGMLFGEAVIFFNRQTSKNFRYIRKSGMQLVSKMRFIGAQFNALLNNNLWYDNAKNANDMAQLLKSKIDHLDQLTINQKVQVNSLLATMPAESIPALQAEYPFYVWDQKKSEVRWMTTFDTTQEDVNNFSQLIIQTLSQPAGQKSILKQTALPLI
jgi:threonine aldolase